MGNIVGRRLSHVISRVNVGLDKLRSKSVPVKCFCTNCDSLPNKWEDLRVYVVEHKINVVALTVCIP